MKNLLDFMVHLLCNHRLLNQDPTGVNINQRAREFMIKVISKTLPIIPPSLIVTGVNMPVQRDYIGNGIFRGELQGGAVALKELYKSDNDIVSLQLVRLLLMLMPTGPLS
jgi:hypothetical protein